MYAGSQTLQTNKKDKRGVTGIKIKEKFIKITKHQKQLCTKLYLFPQPVSI